jgi:hypothetical protein
MLDEANVYIEKKNLKIKLMLKNTFTEVVSVFFKI